MFTYVVNSCPLFDHFFFCPQKIRSTMGLLVGSVRIYCITAAAHNDMRQLNFIRHTYK